MEDLFKYLPVLNILTTLILLPLIRFIVKIEKKIAIIETTLEFLKHKLSCPTPDFGKKHE